MRDINCTRRRNALAPSGGTNHHAHLKLPDKGRAIKESVACYVAWLGSMIFGMGLWTNAGQGAWVWSFVVVRVAIKLKYRKKYTMIKLFYCLLVFWFNTLKIIFVLIYHLS